MKKNIKSQRQLRVGQQLKHLISEIIIMGDFSNEKLNLRFVPDLTFSFDNTFEYANKIEKILKEPKVLKDL